LFSEVSTLGKDGSAVRRTIAAATGSGTPERSTWALVQGTPIHARVAQADGVPSDPPVVLVHGTGMSSRYLMPLAARLGAARRVIVPDLPGYGLSGDPGRFLSTRELAEALAAFMDSEGIAAAPVLGNSYGCQVAAHLAARRPDLVARLVLQGPTLDPAARTKARQMIRWARNLRREPREMWPHMIRDYRNAGIRRVMKTGDEVIADHIEDVLPDIEAPTLLVVGNDDVFVPLAWARELAGLLPQGELVQMEGAHTLNLQAPDALASVAGTFLLGGEAERQKELRTTA
jgi:2-hydroxy-6-oxonona-2,4-dienedioate hydrolase